MLLLHAQRKGHAVLAVVGGATALVGDPSGRTKDRNAINDDELVVNSTRVTNTLLRLFKNNESMVEQLKGNFGKKASTQTYL